MPTTYRQAKDGIWTALEAAGWTMSRPTLKIPHATFVNYSHSDDDRIHFRPQALYLNAHSLHVDIRKMSTDQVVAYIHSTMDSRNASEYF